MSMDYSHTFPYSWILLGMGPRETLQCSSVAEYAILNTQKTQCPLDGNLWNIKIFWSGLRGAKIFYRVKEGVQNLFLCPRGGLEFNFCAFGTISYNFIIAGEG